MSETFQVTGCTNCCGGVQTDCCPNLIPNTLTMTFSNFSGTCGCLPSPVTLIWQFAQIWRGSGSGCGQTITWQLQCSAGVWQLSSTECGVNSAPNPKTCDPFSLSFIGLTCPGACAGTYDVTITP